MKQGFYKIRSNERIADQVYRMVLQGDITAITTPGQFVNIALDGKYLRRPISVSDWAQNEMTLIYKTVGEGTKQMSTFLPGKELDLLIGLGNGFDLEPSGDHPLIVGGGIGTAPLLGLCKRLAMQGKKPTVVLGFNTSDEVFAVKEFESYGAKVILATADGSAGVRGFVTDAMAGLAYTYFYACGPMPMFRAMEKVVQGDGQYSFEERMGCGFGACMGCTCQTKNGYKRICKEGPVLKREEVIW